MPKLIHYITIGFDLYFTVLDCQSHIEEEGYRNVKYPNLVAKSLLLT